MLKSPFEPCIPTRRTKVPVSPDWIHEIKHDGYRLIVQREGKRVRLFTRNGHDWSDRYPLITEAALRNRNTSFVIDGEAVLLGVDGISDFDPAGSSTVRVRFRDSDGAGAGARIIFTIRRTNIATGGNEAVFTFDSNTQPPAGVNFQTVTLCQNGLDFDFTQYVYWIEAEINRADAATLVQLGHIEISEKFGPCPP